MEWKFRGKNKETDQWVYGDLIKTEWNSYIRPENRALSFPIYRHIYIAEVIPESVGLWTGLKDKNGVDIYCGDICKRMYFSAMQHPAAVRHKILVVHISTVRGCGTEEFRDILSYPSMSEKDAKNRCLPPHDDFEKEQIIWGGIFRPAKYLEVVGNTTDTPELLEATK